ncbi:MAG: hypothetical protein K1X86_10790 [Ignavibacteria bacterium]|nr:hypothetical protein [Ignavibacteria bacterium]
MPGFPYKLILSLILFTVFASSARSQSAFAETEYLSSKKFSAYLYKDSVDTTPEDTNFTLPRRGYNATIPFALGVASFFYLLNPIILFENDKIALGITKEVSLGFGYFGQDRISFEYSYIFRDYSSSHFRLGYKHDFILSDILPSNFLQTTGVLTMGGGMFNDLDGWGIFPEITYGYSFRNDKLLIYPHVKGRFTYTFRGQKSNIADFSFGVMVGFANPFSELKIRRYW